MHFLSEVEWLKESYATMRRELIAWSNINSGTSNNDGIRLMQKKIKAKFSDLGGDFQQYTGKSYSVIDDRGKKIEQTTGDIIHITKRSEAKYQVILCGHCDTVFAKGNSFQTVTVIDDNTLRGPGVSDMKGGLLVMYYALAALEKFSRKIDLGWQVFINADEETGSIGSASILEKISKNVDVGFVYEPAIDEIGTLAYHRKGSGNFTVCLQGKSAHVGRAFDSGCSAIVALSYLIQKVHALNYHKNLIVNVAKVHGGEALNQVPDFALCRINVRTKEISDEQLFMDEMDSIMKSVSEAHNITFSLHGQFNRKPKRIDAINKKLYAYILNQGKHLGIDLPLQETGGCCDGNNLFNLGIPNVDTLGVRGGKIHTAEEYIKLDSLVERAQLSAMTLMSIASGHLDLKL